MEQFVFGGSLAAFFRGFDDCRQCGFGIPGSGLFDAFTGPFHATIDPVFTPFFVADAVVVIADAELESARRTDLKGAAARAAARGFVQFGITTNRTRVGGGFHLKGSRIMHAHRSQTMTDANLDQREEKTLPTANVCACHSLPVAVSTAYWQSCFFLTSHDPSVNPYRRTVASQRLRQTTCHCNQVCEICTQGYRIENGGCQACKRVSSSQRDEVP